MAYQPVQPVVTKGKPIPETTIDFHDPILERPPITDPILERPHTITEPIFDRSNSSPTTQPNKNTAQTCATAMGFCGVVIGGIEAAIQSQPVKNNDVTIEEKNNAALIQKANLLSTLNNCLQNQGACDNLTSTLSGVLLARASTQNLPIRPGVVPPIQGTPTTTTTPTSSVVSPTQLVSTSPTTTTTTRTSPVVPSLKTRSKNCGSALANCSVKRLKNLKNVSSTQLGQVLETCLDTNAQVKDTCTALETVESVRLSRQPQS